MTWGIIGTWRMALEGVREGARILDDGGEAGDAVEESIKIVEDYPYYKSVGYGGLPNEKCQVELDAAYMDGDSLAIGALAGLKDFENPISIARELSKERFNSFLIGAGAEEYGSMKGFVRKNMLTERSIIHYKNRLKRTMEKGLDPYDGHDTVGVLALDRRGKMVVGTSTSGLFMKKQGRVGDSPLAGSGFYVDSEVGGATATGLGEDIMKGCISYEIVRLMKEGYSPQEAADQALGYLDKELKRRQGKVGDISVVCMSRRGEFGVSSNIEEFSFVLARKDEGATVYISRRLEGRTVYKEASKAWLRDFMKRKLAPVSLE